MKFQVWLENKGKEALLRNLVEQYRHQLESYHGWEEDKRCINHCLNNFMPFLSKSVIANHLDIRKHLLIMYDD